MPAGFAVANPGDRFIAEFDREEDATVFRKLTNKSNWLDVLKVCPVKMDDLPARGRRYSKRLKL